MAGFESAAMRPPRYVAGCESRSAAMRPPRNVAPDMIFEAVWGPGSRRGLT